MLLLVLLLVLLLLLLPTPIPLRSHRHRSHLRRCCCLAIVPHPPTRSTSASRRRHRPLPLPAPSRHLPPLAECQSPVWPRALVKGPAHRLRSEPFPIETSGQKGGAGKSGGWTGISRFPACHSGKFNNRPSIFLHIRPCFENQHSHRDWLHRRHRRSRSLHNSRFPCADRR